MQQRMSSSLSTRSQACTMISIISVLSALRACGRVGPDSTFAGAPPLSGATATAFRSTLGMSLSRNVTRSSLVAVALNIADLAEHAIDAVPDRVALISGDQKLTYAQLEEKANRLAHYLIDQGVQRTTRSDCTA